MNPVISVIVPVYKVEPYLRKCVDSIIDQTFREIEIILVDDGSPDNCGRICDEYAARDSRIRVIHKENGGLSSARNAGIAIARGEFLGFVDSDDWIDPDMYEFLYSNLVKENADISVCGMYLHKGAQMTSGILQMPHCVLQHSKAIRAVIAVNQGGIFAWNKLYHRSLFSEIRFPEGRLFEDAFVMVHLMDAAKNVSFHMVPKYHYLQRENSITSSEYRPAMRDMADAHFLNYNYIARKYPELEKEAKLCCLMASFNILDMMLLHTGPVDETEKKQYIQYLRANKMDVFRSPGFSFSRKIAMLLLCIHKLLYTCLIRLRHS